MKRLALAALLVCACFDFDGALSKYQDEAACSKGIAKCPTATACDEQPCGVDSDCCSGQCIAGVCKPMGTYATGECADTTDCAPSTLCAPSSQGLGYRCVSNAACQPEGTLCKQASECCQGDCSMCSRACTAGLCRVGSCGGTDAGCLNDSNCCAGFECIASTHLCQAAPNGFDTGAYCEFADECASRYCNASGQCSTPALPTLGQTCAGGSCADPFTCTNNVCCSSKPGQKCFRDDTCCTGRCVGGYCAPAGACRRLGTFCTKSSDCCTGGVCDPNLKKCTTTCDAGACP
jgi:hypothetical protein